MNELHETTRKALAAYRGEAGLDGAGKDALWGRLSASVEAGQTGPSLRDAPREVPRAVPIDTWRSAGRIAIALAAAAAVLLLIRAIDWRGLGLVGERASAREQAVYGAGETRASGEASAREGDASIERATTRPRHTGADDEAPTTEDAGTIPPEPADAATTDDAIDSGSEGDAARNEAGRRPGSESRDRPRTPAPANDNAKMPAEDPAPSNPGALGGLAEEMRLMRQAEALLGEDPAKALGILAQHAATYADGQMAEDRQALRVRALCAAGRSAEAGTAARAFLAAYGASAHRGQVAAVQTTAREKKCGTP